MFSIEIKPTKHVGVAMATLCKNGRPISPENPAIEKEELVDFHKALLKLNTDTDDLVIVVSGMPLSFVVTACLVIKNKCTAIAVHNPRFGGCFIVHSTVIDYRVGDFLEL